MTSFNLILSYFLPNAFLCRNHSQSSYLAAFALMKEVFTLNWPIDTWVVYDEQRLASFFVVGLFLRGRCRRWTEQSPRQSLDARALRRRARCTRRRAFLRKGEVEPSTADARLRGARYTRGDRVLKVTLEVVGTEPTTQVVHASGKPVAKIERHPGRGRERGNGGNGSIGLRCRRVEETGWRVKQRSKVTQRTLTRRSFSAGARLIDTSHCTLRETKTTLQTERQTDRQTDIHKQRYTNTFRHAPHSC